MRLMVSLLIMTFILAACGGEAAPTSAVSSDPTIDPNSVTATPNDFVEQQLEELNATEEVDADGNFVIVTPQSEVRENAVPLPGTLAFDEDFVDENMDAVFTRIVFVRFGGGDDAPAYRLELNQDGTYELSGDIFGQVAGDTITRLDNMLDDINYFAIDTPMMGPGPDAINYRYIITVERGDDALTIRAEDGFTPQAMNRLFGALLGIIADSQNTAFATSVPTG